MDKKGIIVFSEKELNILYFSLGQVIQRKREFLRLVSNAFLLNVLNRELTELEILKNKVTSLKNKLKNADNIK